MNTRNKHSKWTRERNERIYRRYMAGETAFQIAQELHMAIKALLDAGPDDSGASEYAEWLIPSQLGSIPDGADTYTVVTRYSADIEEDIISFSRNSFKLWYC